MPARPTGWKPIPRFYEPDQVSRKERRPRRGDLGEFSRFLGEDLGGDSTEAACAGGRSADYQETPPEIARQSEWQDRGTRRSDPHFQRQIDRAGWKAGERRRIESEKREKKSRSTEK